MRKTCQNCKKSLKTYQSKYCSNRCQIDYQYLSYIDKWKLNSKNGGRGISTKNISRHIKRYLIQTNGEKCNTCGWNKKHQVTGKVPLEVDHIDGDSNNNNIKNLKLLCPNCHALTVNFRNLNKGKGRKWRGKNS